MPAGNERNASPARTILGTIALLVILAVLFLFSGWPVGCDSWILPR